jgi:fibronectin type 3 domain-containing protein
LTASEGNSQVRLNWQSSSGAANYNVERSITSGGPYSLVSTVVGTNYTDSSVTNGVNYYYAVSAVNGPLSSGNSIEATATPHAAALLSVTADSDSQITLSWTDGVATVDYASNLTAPVNWSQVTNVPAFTNGRWTLSLPTTNSSQGFYWLQQ